MDDRRITEESASSRRSVLKLFAYFGVLVLLTIVAQFLVRGLEGSTMFAGLAKANQIIADSLDITRHRDDTIVTLWSLLLTLLLVIPVAWTYALTKSKDSYDTSLVQILIVMALVVCGMMMIIQDNFSRALALVGAVSAVRFRTSLDDAKDAVYVLIAIAIGMGTGLHVYRVAAWIALIMCIVFIALAQFHFGESAASDGGLLDYNGEKKKKKKKKAEAVPDLTATQPE